MTQAMQVVVQNNIDQRRAEAGRSTASGPLFARIINAIPWLQGIAARFVAIGVRPEHVHSPALPAS